MYGTQNYILKKVRTSTYMKPIDLNLADHRTILRRVSGRGRHRRQQEHHEQLAPLAPHHGRERPRHQGPLRRQRLPVRAHKLLRQRERERERRDASVIILQCSAKR